MESLWSESLFFKNLEYQTEKKTFISICEQMQSTMLTF